jgi:hypothetical protein
MAAKSCGYNECSRSGTFVLIYFDSVFQLCDLGVSKAGQARPAALTLTGIAAMLITLRYFTRPALPLNA